MLSGVAEADFKDFVSYQRHHGANADDRTCAQLTVRIPPVGIKPEKSSLKCFFIR
jgi:hypothetical protein